MRSAGILLHISSLYDRYGIGTLGKCAFDFVDFLRKSGTEYWQMLPLGPTGYGDSPYQSFSAFAGNPNFIDLTLLIEAGLLSADDPALKELEARKWTTYESLWEIKKQPLARAFAAFAKAESGAGGACSAGDARIAKDFEHFCTENAVWLDDYALYMAIKYKHNKNCWIMWEDLLRKREKAALEAFIAEDSKDPAAPDSVGFWKFCQYLFYSQYENLRTYAKENHIKIIGDMPIYVSLDSSDIWANPELFELDEDLRPVNVAGCPPDDFAKTGQLWGNPVYYWFTHYRTTYKWWFRRLEAEGKRCDLLRLDHFRGYESFYAIPAGDATAEHGTWKVGPGAHMFEVAEEMGVKAPKLIAEDLGFITRGVEEMLSELGLPGMNVLQFAFGGDDSRYLPHNYVNNSVSYIGTHDNDTANGWFSSLDKKTQKRIRKYTAKADDESAAKALLRTLAMSVSEIVVFQMQDILDLGSEARMNTPSTVGGGNWLWQLRENDLTNKTAESVRKLLTRYFRLGPPHKVRVKDINTKAIITNTKEQ
jgi:4-alpha-glucanotransferase